MLVERAKRTNLFGYNDLSNEQLNNSRINSDEIKKSTSKLASFPKRLILELTNVCNLKCVMCGRDESDFAQTYFDIDLLSKFESTFHLIEEVTLFGWGEPTMHPKFKEFLQFFNQYPVKKYFVTNGMFLDKLLTEIFDNHVDIIAVSLDGSIEKTNNDIRLKSDFKKIIDNIQHLVEVRNKRGLSYPYINFVMTLMKDNLEELPEMVLLAHKLGVDEVKVVYLTGFNADMSNKVLWGYQEKVRNVFKHTLELGNKFNIKVKLPHIQGEDPAGKHMHKSCHVAWRDFFIGSDGYVRACQSTAHKLFHHSKYKSFEDMWNSEELQIFRSVVNDESNMQNECQRCYQSSHANWNKKLSFIQNGKEFAPIWVKRNKKKVAI